MISLAFGIDESEFGAEALLLARAVITDWRIAKVSGCPSRRGESCFLLTSRGNVGHRASTNVDYGSRADSTWSCD